MVAFISRELPPDALAVEERSRSDEQDYNLDLGLCHVSSSFCAMTDEMCAFSTRQKCLGNFCRGLIPHSY